MTSTATGKKTNDLKRELAEVRMILEWFADSPDWQKELAKLAYVSPAFITRVKLHMKKNGSGREWQSLCDTLNNPRKVTIDREKKTACLTEKPVRVPRKTYLKKVAHPIYFYLDKHDPCWSSLLEVAAMTDKKVLVIRDLDFEKLQRGPEEKIEVQKDVITLDDHQPDLFWKTIADKNELIDVFRPKKWQIGYGKHHFNMLMVHRGSRLRKTLAEFIEAECVSSLLQSAVYLKDNAHNVEDPPGPRKRIKLTHDSDPLEVDEQEKRRRQQHIIDDEKRKANLVYPPQMSVAQQAYDILLKKLMITHNITTVEGLKEKFNDFQFIVLQPDRTSLEDQTRNRILEGAEFYTPNGVLDPSDAERVVRINGKMDEKWKTFRDSVLSNPRTLHMVIHDECHWGTGLKQSAYKLLGFEDHGDYHLDTKKGSLIPNLITLMVSATPYNFFSRLKSQDLLQWSNIPDLIKKAPPSSHDEAGKSSTDTVNKNTSYRGLSEFRRQDMIIASKLVHKTEIEAKFASQIINGFSVEFLEVMLDYLSSLALVAATTANTLWFSPSTTVQQSVLKCIKDRKVIVIRLCSAKDDIRQSAVAKQALLSARHHFNLDFEVMENAGDNAGIDLGHFLPRHLSIVAYNGQSRSGDHVQYFNDVEGVPVFMIIVERGRMGDTFPSSCILFDLRARYLSIVNDFTPIIQDVGRAFGYGERPILLLSQKADQFLRKVWSDETNTISWKALTTFKALLGRHMKRVVNGEIEGKDLDKSDVIANFKRIYGEDGKNPSFLYNLKHDGFRHRLVLTAKPQIGKTGAFIHLVYLFRSLLRPVDLHAMHTELEKRTDEYYSQKSLGKIEEDLKTEEGKMKHQRYVQVLLPFSREKLQKEGILEPAEWAALCLVDDVIKNGYDSNVITIADIGCGDNKFTDFLTAVVENNKEKLGTKIFKVYAYDISPNRYWAPKDTERVKLNYKPGTACVEKGKFHYTVCTLALFGNGDTWHQTVRMGLDALVNNGRLMLAEFKERLPANAGQKLSEAGVDCSFYRIPGDLKTARLFSDKFVAINCLKTMDYDPGSLKECLPSR